MNTYAKYCPNVFVAKCDQEHAKGSTIIVTTKYGKENECIVFNLVKKSEDAYYYSVVRADGFNMQEFAKKRAEQLLRYSNTAAKKSNDTWEAANEGKDFLALGEPIKVGHHSERRHRALIDRNHNRMHQAVELEKEAQEYEQRAEYWKRKENEINLSMPESILFYEHKLEQAIKRQEGLKSGAIKKEHSYSLPYATKDVRTAEANVKLAKILWG
jgi:hypothetical protein